MAILALTMLAHAETLEPPTLEPLNPTLPKRGITTANSFVYTLDKEVMITRAETTTSPADVVIKVGFSAKEITIEWPNGVITKYALTGHEPLVEDGQETRTMRGYRVDAIGCVEQVVFTTSKITLIATSPTSDKCTVQYGTALKPALKR